MPDVYAILHFLGEDVSRVALSSNVDNPNALVLNQFPDGVLTEFHMTDTFGGKVIRPLDT